MKDINKKEPGADPAPADPPAPAADPTPAEPTAEPTAEPAAVSLTEESVRKICEEVIGAFLDRFSPEVKQDDPPPAEPEDESFDY